NAFGIYMVAAKAAWWGLLFVALQFMAVGARLKQDRTFLLLGALMLTICLFVGFDVWILVPEFLAGVRGRVARDACQLAPQILACGGLYVVLELTRRLTGRPSRRTAFAVVAGCAGFALIAILDAFLPALIFTGFRAGKETVSPFYSWTF